MVVHSVWAKGSNEGNARPPSSTPTTSRPASRFDRPWWGHGEPIYVSVGAWHETVGRLRNIRFRNILARSENGCNVAADAPGLIEGVLLEGVRVELNRWTRRPGGEYDRRPTSHGPEVYRRQAAGFLVDTARDVTIRDGEVVWATGAPEFGHAVDALDVDGLVVEGLRGGPAGPSLGEAVRERRRQVGEERYPDPVPA